MNDDKKHGPRKPDSTASKPTRWESPRQPETASRPLPPRSEGGTTSGAGPVGDTQVSDPTSAAGGPPGAAAEPRTAPSEDTATQRAEPPTTPAAEPRSKPERRRGHEQRRYVMGRIEQIVDYLFFLLYGLLGIRFALSLFGASETAGFVQFIHSLTEPFYVPFSGIVNDITLNGGRLDLALIIALLAYMILHVAIRGLLRLVADGKK